MSEKEVIERVRKSWEDGGRFFSNISKPERERWIVIEFRKIRDIKFNDEDLISRHEFDDVDVEFRSANFQVKELTESNCKRRKENKENLERARTAKNLRDLIPPLIARNKIYYNAFPRILELASNSKYPFAARAKLDLLIYVTDTDATINLSLQPSELARCGWRSISCIFGKNAYVLVTSETAPIFLRT